MWNGKSKALTFSFDDGIEQDRRLVELFQKYGMKCTFNLNSGIQTAESTWENQGVRISRMDVQGLPQVYAGHEIAVHSLTHPDLTQLDEETIYHELNQDKINLEQLFGQKIVGMAYPYGTYNNTVIAIAEKIGLRYARTVYATGEFFAPSSQDIQNAGSFQFAPDFLMTLPATCHYHDENLLELGKRFLELPPDPLQPRVFYVWGHSYELDVNNDWDRMEEFCRMMADQKDIFYGTNAQVLLGQ